MALIFLGVLITLNLILTFLAIAAIGRSFLIQADFNAALVGHIDELTQNIESATDCLVAEDARLTELLEQKQTSGEACQV